MAQDRMLLKDDDEIHALLDRHHEASATKNIEVLRRVFSSCALFIGTDDTEKWTRAQLLTALEETEAGWDMTDCKERHVYSVFLQPEVATFFEVVRHTKYGLLRGAGTVVKEAGLWRISLYALSFSVPNRVVDTTNIIELLAQK